MGLEPRQKTSAVEILDRNSNNNCLLSDTIKKAYLIKVIPHNCTAHPFCFIKDFE